MERQRLAAVLLLLLTAAPPVHPFGVYSQQLWRSNVSPRCHFLKRRCKHQVHGKNQESLVASTTALHGYDKKHKAEITDLLDATVDGLDGAVRSFWSFLSVGVVQIRTLYLLVFGLVWMSTNVIGVVFFIGWFVLCSRAYRGQFHNDGNDLFCLVLAFLSLGSLPGLPVSIFFYSLILLVADTSRIGGKSMAHRDDVDDGRL